MEIVWRVSGRYLAGVWWVSGGCLKGVWKVPGRCLNRSSQVGTGYINVGQV